MSGGLIDVCAGVVFRACAWVRRLPFEDAWKMVASVWSYRWSSSAGQVTRTEAQLTVVVPCWVPDESVKKMMSVLLGTGRRTIAVG